MIEINNLQKSYNDKIIFQNFNLKVNKGDFLWIYGKSGSGKSTLLNMIGMLDNDFEGEIKLLNKINPIISRDTKKILENDLSYLFQNYGLIDNESIKYNLKIIKNVEKNKNKKVLIKKTLKEVGLQNIDIDQSVFELSGGEQQRLAIAKILLKKPKLILCDEPTGSLDEENANATMELLKKLNEQGTTILMVSHDKRVEKYINKKIEIK